MPDQERKCVTGLPHNETASSELIRRHCFVILACARAPPSVHHVTCGKLTISCGTLLWSLACSNLQHLRPFDALPDDLLHRIANLVDFDTRRAMCACEYAVLQMVSSMIHCCTTGCMSACCRRLALPLISKRWNGVIQSIDRWDDCCLVRLWPPRDRSFKPTCILRSGRGLHQYSNQRPSAHRLAACDVLQHNIQGSYAGGSASTPAASQG